MNKNKKALLGKKLLKASIFLLGIGSLGLISWFIYNLQNKKQDSDTQELFSDEKIYQNWKARVIGDNIVIFDENDQIITNPLQKLYDIDSSLELSVVSNYDIVKKSYDKYGSFNRWKLKCPEYNSSLYYLFFEELEKPIESGMYWNDWWTNYIFSENSNEVENFAITNPIEEAQKQNDYFVSFEQFETKNDKCRIEASKKIFGILVGEDREKFQIINFESFFLKLSDRPIKNVFWGFDEFNKHMKIQSGIDKTYSYHNILESNVLIENFEEASLSGRQKSIDTYGDLFEDEIFLLEIDSQKNFWILGKENIKNFDEFNHQLDLQDQTKSHNYQSFDQILNDSAFNAVLLEGKTVDYFGYLFLPSFVSQCGGFSEITVSEKTKQEYCSQIFDKQKILIKKISEDDLSNTNASFAIKYQGEELEIPNIDILNFILKDQISEEIFNFFVTFSEATDVSEVMTDIIDETPTPTSSETPSDEPQPKLQLKFLRIFNDQGEFNPWFKELKNFDSAVEEFEKETSIKKFAPFFTTNDQLNKDYLKIENIDFDQSENIINISFKNTINIDDEIKNISFKSLKDLNLELKKQKSDFIELNFEDIDETFNNFDVVKSISLYGDLKNQNIFIDFDSTTNTFTFQILNMKKMKNFQVFINQIKNQIKDLNGEGLDFSHLSNQFTKPLVFVELFENNLQLLFNFNHLDLAMAKYFKHFFGSWSEQTFNIETYDSNYNNIVFVLKEDQTKKITGLNDLKKIISIQKETFLENLTDTELLETLDNFWLKKSIFNFGSLVTNGSINKELINVNLENNSWSFFIPDHSIMTSISSFNLELQRQGFNGIFNIENSLDLEGFKNYHQAKSIFDHGKQTNWTAQMIGNKIEIFDAKNQIISFPETEINFQDDAKKLADIKNYSEFSLQLKNVNEFLSEEQTLLQEIENFEILEKNLIKKADQEIIFIGLKIKELNDFYQSYLEKSLNFKQIYILSSSLFTSLENKNAFHEKLKNLNYFLEGLRIKLKYEEILEIDFSEKYESYIEDHNIFDEESDGDAENELFVSQNLKLDLETEYQKINHYFKIKSDWEKKSDVSSSYKEKIISRLFDLEDEEKILESSTLLKMFYQKIEENIFWTQSKLISSKLDIEEINSTIESIQETISTSKDNWSDERKQEFEKSWEIKLKILLNIKKGKELWSSYQFDLDNIDFDLNETQQKIIDIEDYLQEYQELDEFSKEAFDLESDKDWKSKLDNYYQKLLELLKFLTEEELSKIYQEIEDIINDPKALSSIQDQEIDQIQEKIKNFKTFLDDLSNSEKNHLTIEFIDEEKKKLDDFFANLVEAKESLILSLEKPIIIIPENFGEHFGNDYILKIDQIIEKIKDEISKVSDHIEIYNSLGESGKEKYGDDITDKLNHYINDLEKYLQGLNLKKNEPKMISLDQVSKNPAIDFHESLKKEVAEKINEFNFFLSEIANLSDVGNIVFVDTEIVNLKNEQLNNLIDYEKGLHFYENKPTILEDILTFSKDELNTLISDITIHIENYNVLSLNEFVSKGYGPSYTSALIIFHDRLFDRLNGLILKEEFPEIPNIISSFSIPEIFHKISEITKHLQNYNDLKTDGLKEYEINKTSILQNYLERLYDREQGLLLKEKIPTTSSDITSFSIEDIVAKKDQIDIHLNSYHQLETDGQTAYQTDQSTILNNFKDRLLEREQGLLLKENIPEIQENIESFSMEKIIAKKNEIDLHLNSYNELKTEGNIGYGEDQTSLFEIFQDRLQDRENGLLLKENVPTTPSDITSFSIENIIAKKDQIDVHLNSYNELKTDGETAYQINPITILNPYKDRLLDREQGLLLKEKITTIPTDITSFSIDDITEKENEIDVHLNNYNELKEEGKFAFGEDLISSLNNYKDRLLDRKNGLLLKENAPTTPGNITTFTQQQIVTKINEIEEHLANYQNLKTDGFDAYGPEPTIIMIDYGIRLVDREQGLLLKENIPTTPSDISTFSTDDIIAKKDQIDIHLNSYNELKTDGQTAYQINPTTILNPYKDRLVDREQGLLLKENVPTTPSDISTFSKNDIIVKKNEIDIYLNSYNELKTDGKLGFGNDPTATLNSYKNLLDERKEGFTLKENAPQIIDNNALKLLSHEDILLKITEVNEHLQNYIDLNDNGKSGYGENITDSNHQLQTFLQTLSSYKKVGEIKNSQPDISSPISNYSIDDIDQIDQKKSQIDNFLTSYYAFNSAEHEAFGPFDQTLFEGYRDRLLDWKNGLLLKENTPTTPSDLSSFTHQQVVAKFNEIEEHLANYQNLKIDGFAAYGPDSSIALIDYGIRLLEREQGLLLKENIPTTPSDISAFSFSEIYDKIAEINEHLTNYNALDEDGVLGYGIDPTSSLKDYLDRLFDRQHGFLLNERFPETPENITSFSMNDIIEKKDEIDIYLNSYHEMNEDGKTGFGTEPTAILNSYKDRLNKRKEGFILKENASQIIDNNALKLLSQENILLKITEVNEHLQNYNDLNDDGKSGYGENINDSNHQLQTFLQTLSSYKKVGEIKDLQPDISLPISDYSIDDIDQIDQKKSQIDNFLTSYYALNSVEHEAFGPLDQTLFEDYRDRLLDWKNGLLLKENTPTTPSDLSSFTLQQVVAKFNEIEEHLANYQNLKTDGFAAYGPDSSIALIDYGRRLLEREQGLLLKENIPTTPSDISAFSFSEIYDKIAEIKEFLTNYNALDEDGVLGYGIDPTPPLQDYLVRLFNRQYGFLLNERFPKTPENITSFSMNDIIEKKDEIDIYLNSYHEMNEDGKSGFGTEPTAILNPYKDRLNKRKEGFILKENAPQIIDNNALKLLSHEDILLKITEVNEHLQNYNDLNDDGKSGYGENINDSNHQLQTFLQTLSSYKKVEEIKNSQPNISLPISDYSIDDIDQIDQKISQIDNFLTSYHAFNSVEHEAFGPFDQTLFEDYRDRLLDWKNGLLLKENVPTTPSDLSSFTHQQVVAKFNEIEEHLANYQNLKTDGFAAYGPDSSIALIDYGNRLLDREQGLLLKENIPTTPSDISTFSIDDIIAKKDQIDLHLNSYNNLKEDGKSAHEISSIIALNTYKDRLQNRENGLLLKENVPTTPSDITTFSMNDIMTKKNEIDLHLNSYLGINEDGKEGYGTNQIASLNTYKDRLIDREQGLVLKENIPTTPSDITTFSKNDIIAKKNEIDLHLNSYNELKTDGQTAYQTNQTTILNTYKDRLIDREQGLLLKENAPTTPTDISSFTQEQIIAKKDQIDLHLNSYNNLKEDGKSAYGISSIIALNTYKDRLQDRENGLLLKENVPTTPSDISTFSIDDIIAEKNEIDIYLSDFNNLKSDEKEAFEIDPTINLNTYKDRLLDREQGLLLKENVPTTPSDLSAFSMNDIIVKKDQIDLHLNSYNELEIEGKTAYGTDPTSTLNNYLDRLADREQGLNLKATTPDTSLLVSTFDFSNAQTKILQIDQHLNQFDTLTTEGKTAYAIDPTLSDSDLNIYKQKLNDHIEGLQMKEELNNLLSTNISLLPQNEINNKINEIDQHVLNYQNLKIDGKASYGFSDPVLNDSLNQIKNNLVDRYNGLELKKEKDQLYIKYLLNDSNASLIVATNEEVTSEIEIINNHLSKFNDLSSFGLQSYENDISDQFNNYQNRLLNFKKGLEWLEDEAYIATNNGTNVEGLGTLNVDNIAPEQTSLWINEVKDLKNAYLTLDIDGINAVNKNVENDDALPINIFYQNLLKRKSILNFGNYQNWEIKFNGTETIDDMFFTSQDHYGNNVVISNDIYLDELKKQGGEIIDGVSYYIWITKQTYGDLWNQLITINFDQSTNELKFQVSGKKEIVGLDMFNQILDILRNGIIDKSDDYYPFEFEEIGLTLQNFENVKFPWSVWTYGGDIFNEGDFFCNSWNVGCENHFPRGRFSISKIFFDDTYNAIDASFNFDNSNEFGADENAYIKNLKDLNTLMKWHGYPKEDLIMREHVRNTWFNSQYYAVLAREEKRHSLESFGPLFIDSEPDYIDKNVLTIERFNGKSVDNDGSFYYFRPTFSILNKEKTIFSTDSLNLHLSKQEYQGSPVISSEYNNTWNGFDKASSIYDFGDLFNFEIHYFPSENLNSDRLFLIPEQDSQLYLSFETLNNELNKQGDTNPNYTNYQELVNNGFNMVVVQGTKNIDHQLFNQLSLVSFFHFLTSFLLISALFFKGIKMFYQKWFKIKK